MRMQKWSNYSTGLRVTFQRGYLAPVYNFTKASNIGLVFESSDEDTSKELRLQ